MKAASASEIKNSLKDKSPAELIELCLRLSRFKKENKELLTYLLFEADDMDAFLQSVKSEINEGFDGINTSNIYFIKKSLRKILRNTNKYIRYTGSKTAETDLLLHFVTTLKNAGIAYTKSTALNNLYGAQLKKIQTNIATLHEDLQHDYERQLQHLL